MSTPTDSAKKASHDEPVATAEEGYAFDGEQASPASPGLRNMKRSQDDDDFVTSGDRACNVIAVALLFMILLTSIISIAAGACCLSSLSGKPFNHFSMFFAFGVTPVVVGCVCFALSLFVIIFIACCAMGLRRYGMCCYGTSRCRGGCRVCLLGVFPFIVFIVLLAMCILGFTFYSLSQQIPPLDKNYTKVSGLYGPVEIMRDENGLTHVKASTRHDAYFGQGFAAAQDRLFQLEFMRMVAQGKLSSLVGNDGFSTDTSIRTINVRDAAYAMCNVTDPIHLTHLTAFADGVNLYLKRVSKRPVEFFFMGSRALYFHDPDPFYTKDICLIARLYQWQMSSNIDKEGARFADWAGTNRTYNEVEELYPNFAAQTETILTAAQVATLLTDLGSTDPAADVLRYAQADQVGTLMESTVYDILLNVVRSQLQASQASSSTALHASIEESLARVMHTNFYSTGDRSVFPNRFIEASNAWAARDASGHAVAASDPHLTTNLPSVWYYTHLSFPAEDGQQYDAAGVELIGLPGVHIGRTTYAAWGITMSMTDLEDLFILPPASFTGLPDRTYMYDGALRQYVTRRERIQIKGKKDYVLDVEDTLFGPVVSSMLGFPASLSVALYAIPLLHDDNESVPALMALTDPTVNSAQKVMDALLQLQAPGFSIPIADVDGNIAYVVTGRHPVRDKTAHTGKYPTCAFDAPGILGTICASLTQTPVDPADHTAVLTCMSTLQGSLQASGAGLDLTSVLPMLPGIFSQLSGWTTFVSSDPSVADVRVPAAANPHVHIAVATGADHISCANQKIVPNGYPYMLGYDYALPYRGNRIQELLDANSANLGSLEVHRTIQMDHRTNFWNISLRPVVQSADFQSLIAGNSKAVAWANRLVNDWDSNAVIGSVETAFVWRWYQRMSVVPADVLAVRDSVHMGSGNAYVVTMLSSSATTRMLQNCAVAMGAGASAATASSCIQFAAQGFMAVADTDPTEKWGVDVNHLRGIHQMLEHKIIHPVFQREMEKAGDFSTVAVSGNSADGNFLSTQASSMRQLYDMQSGYVLFALPGGNSGNPYSKYYQNMWDKFAKEEYVSVAINSTSMVNMTIAHYQVLSE